MLSLETIFIYTILALSIVNFIIGFIIIVNSKKFKTFFTDTIAKRILNKKLDKQKLTNFCNQLASVLSRLSNDVVGALIVVKGKDNLDSYIKLGYPVKAHFSSEFVVNIFYNKNSPLHDGGLIIADTDIVATSCYFPMTKKNLATSYGARHRAAVGITEETDSIALIVSETSGNILYAMKGEIHRLSKDVNTLSQQIHSLIVKGDIYHTQNKNIMINNVLE